MEGALCDLSREQWSDPRLLHMACEDGDTRAVRMLLDSKMVDANTRREDGLTPAHTAALHGQERVLALLCAAGADLRLREPFERANSLDCALAVGYPGTSCAYFLIANGLRTATVLPISKMFLFEELMVYEQRVLSCRLSVVALLMVKRAGSLWKWDKFLVREIACELWATRYE